MPYQIEPIESSDQKDIGAAVRERWGNEKIIVHKDVFITSHLPGLKAIEKGEMIGFLHYQIREDCCEIISLASQQSNQGIGTALVETLAGIAKDFGCKTLKVTTTNDNMAALIFYQRCGFLMAGLGLGFVDEARKLKPEIPEIGDHNIPIHDEIYLEKPLVTQNTQ